MTQDQMLQGHRLCAELEEAMTTRNGNGGFACEPASAAEGSIPCPCCGGSLTPAMLKDILAAARRAENGEAASAPGAAACRRHDDHRPARPYDLAYH